MNYLNNFKIIKNEISSFKKKINIIVVTKNQSLDKIIPFVDDGHNHFGENRVQEALSKWDILNVILISGWYPFHVKLLFLQA